MNPEFDQALAQAIAHHKAGRRVQAEAGYEALVAGHPNNAVAHHLLGLLRLQLGRPAQAIASLETAATAAGAPPEFFPAVVDASRAIGEIARAIHWQRLLIAKRPRLVEARVRLGQLLMEAGRTEESIAELMASIALNPPKVEIIWNNVGVVLMHARQHSRAVEPFRRAIGAAPSYAEAHKNLGDALRELRQFDEAAESYRAALRCRVRYAEARIGLGLSFYERADFPAALEQMRLATLDDPANVNAWANLSLCQSKLASLPEAETAIRRAVELDLADASLHSTLIALLNYSKGDVPGVVLDEAKRWSTRHASAHALRPPRHGHHRRLRIGYLSPDFHSHAVSYFIEPVLRHHNRDAVEIHCYSNVQNPDSTTARLRELADEWRDITRINDDAVAELIRADEIDVLIDLCGHLIDNRLPVLARQPARVQGIWLGYPNTSGMPQVDFRLTDAFTDPVGASDAFYTEQLVRLPDGFFVYQPPAEAPLVGPPPMLRNRHVTFGSFNNITKLTPAILRLWGRVLNAVPDAQLLIAAVAVSAQETMRQKLSAAGIDLARVRFAPNQSLSRFLELHNEVDIALDSFPWAGHTTTCHCLWMGVPVVSLAGPTAVSRAGASVMGNLQMEGDWVADFADDFVRLAVQHATNAGELIEVRAGLRERMRNSALADAGRFVRNLEEAIISRWNCIES